MPGLRYGPDITDDAAAAMDVEKELRRQLRTGLKGARRTKVNNELKAIEEYTARVFGSKEARNRLAKSSLARQGYASEEDVRSLGARMYKKRTGPGALGLAETPEGREGIGRKKGYKARPAIDAADKADYDRATRAGKQAGRGSQRGILAEVRKQRKKQTDAAAKARAKRKREQEKKKAAQSAAKKTAKKAAPAKKAKKATPPKKAAKKAPAKKKAAAKKAPAKKKPAAKKAAPKRNR